MAVPLPVDPHLDAIRQSLSAAGALVLVAPPGSGKTTRVAPALCEDGPVFLLQPRRIAARALARRIAEERGWTIGEEVGWQVRFERRFSTRTRLLVATEGILTRRLQSDPLLSTFATVILDEFHERSLHADLALAFVREARTARPDLRIVVMSATLDPGPVSEYLGGCPVVTVEGRPHPVETSHGPGASIADAVTGVLERPGGHVLVFLPGAREIRDAERELAARRCEATVLPLYGAQDSDAQDRALAPTDVRKVILATNVAETSLTVDGVTDVVDSGLQRVLRLDPSSGLDRLETERIAWDSAEQRAGRAGRTGPGRALRLWDPREILRPRRESEIQRIDLTGALLEVMAWGADPQNFGWFEPPPAGKTEAALELLARLGAIEGRRLSSLGQAMHRLPLSPRLARVWIEAGGGPRASAVCAVLSERRSAAPRDSVATDSDVLSAADDLDRQSPSVRAAASALRGIESAADARLRPDDAALRRALLAGFPDRVARRRGPGSDRLVLANGQGAVLGRESGVRSGEFLLALEVQGEALSGADGALVRVASNVEAEWLEPTASELIHSFDARSSTVKAVVRKTYDRLVLSEHPTAPDPAAAGELVYREVLRRGLGPEVEALRLRLRFAGLEGDLDGEVRRACAGLTEVPQLGVREVLDPALVGRLERLAPGRLTVPSGRSVALEYREDGTVLAAVKLQELFGLGETPTIGPRAEPVTFSLLAPNGRPVQTTRDLRSFWRTTYAEVRRELRARYPKHPWPEDPWSATPTHRTRGSERHRRA